MVGRAPFLEGLSGDAEHVKVAYILKVFLQRRDTRRGAHLSERMFENFLNVMSL